MSAIPMTLEDALRFSGYTIDAVEYPGKTINTPTGAIVVPPMILSELTWRREEAAPLGGAFYLDRLPCFNPEYAAVQLSMILDRFRGRRLGYDTPDEFGMAVRRWGALHLGAMSTLIRLYQTIATDLPLTTTDLEYVEAENGTATSTTGGTGVDTVSTTDQSTSTSKGRNAQSEFPHGMLAGDGAYASGATDQAVEGTVAGGGTTSANRTTTGTANTTDQKTGNRTEKGRSGATVMELLDQQRAAFVNADMQLLEGLESLFLGVFDRAETGNYGGDVFYGSRSWGW